MLTFDTRYLAQVTDMHGRDTRDVIAGCLLIVVGSISAVYAVANLSLGTFNRMGPGMFPASVSAIVAFLGVCISVPALFREGPVPKVELRPLLAILAALLVFALTIRAFGLFPCVLFSTLVAAAADNKLKPVKIVLLGLGLAFLTYLIFGVGLRVQVPIIAWPW